MIEVRYKSFYKMPMFIYVVIPFFVFAGVPILGILKTFFDMYNVGVNIESVELFFLCFLMIAVFVFVEEHFCHLFGGFLTVAC